MAVEVFLMADVPELGSEGDVVTVADGFARNYLFPRKLGAPVSDATKRRLEKIRRDRGQAEKAAIEAARQLADRLSKVSCTIPVKVSEGEKMFGSVTSGHLVATLKQQGIEIDEKMILLNAPIKELGVYDVGIRVRPDVECAVKVWIVEE